MSPRKGQRLKPEGERKDAQLVLRLTPGELAALQRIASQEDLPVSWLARKGIALIVDQYSQHSKKPKSKQMQ